MRVKSIAPARISLFGGGTDMSSYFKGHGGLIVNAAINLYHTTLLYTRDDIFQPQNSFPMGADAGFYYGLLEKYGLNGMHHMKVQASFDGLIRSGLGSSAAAIISLLGAISKAQNLNLSLLQIAKLAHDYEIERGIYGGLQDQIASAYGGVNVIEFKDEITVVPLARGFLEPLLPSLLLFYFGKPRESGKIQKNFEKLSSKQIKALDKIKELAVLSLDFISRGDFLTIGKMLDESWQLKKESNKGVANKEFEEIYEKALKLGALGGKILGAGGGGYCLFVVPPNKREGFIKDFPLENVDFSVDWNGLQIRIL